MIINLFTYIINWNYIILGNFNETTDSFGGTNKHFPSTDCLAVGLINVAFLLPPSPTRLILHWFEVTGWAFACVLDTGGNAGILLEYLIDVFPSWHCRFKSWGSAFDRSRARFCSKLFLEGTLPWRFVVTTALGYFSMSQWLLSWMFGTVSTCWCGLLFLCDSDGLVTSVLVIFFVLEFLPGFSWDDNEAALNPILHSSVQTAWEGILIPSCMLDR